MNKTIQLKDKDNIDIYPKGASNEYPLGGALVTCVNHGGWEGNTNGNFYQFSAGSWKQYGPMAKTSSLYRAVITVPTGEVWTIKIDWQIAAVDLGTSSGLVSSGIGKWNGTNWDYAPTGTNVQYAGSSGFQYAAGGSWSHEGLRGSCIDRELVAGTYYYAMYIHSTASITIRGNETTTQPTTDNWQNGPSMSFVVYLLDRRKV